MSFIRSGGIVAVTTGRVGVPEYFAVRMSAPANSSPWSEGLSGEASTRTSTSSEDGSGTGTLTSESSSSPFDRASDRSCSAVCVE